MKSLREFVELNELKVPKETEKIMKILRAVENAIKLTNDIKDSMHRGIVLKHLKQAKYTIESRMV